MCGRCSVLETMRPTRILGDVAAHRTRRLAGGIGHKEESARSDALGYRQVDDTRLDTSGAILDVDVENLVEPIHRYDDDAFDRNSPPGEARSHPTAHERNPDVAQTRTTSDTSSVAPGSTTASGGLLKQESGAARCGWPVAKWGSV